MEAFFKDLKHSLRAFAQSPAFTLAAIAALTLGIGANTAIFSVVNAVMLRPVAYPGRRPGRAVHEHLAAGVGPGSLAGEVHALARAGQRHSGCGRVLDRRR